MKLIEIQGLRQGVSELVMGTDFIGMSGDQGADNEVMDQFVAIGGNTMDSARGYVGGRSEVGIGQWIAARGNRAQVNIFTKGAHPDENGSRMSKAKIREDLYNSLEALQTDYIDLYGLHRDDPSVPVGEILEILNEHLEAGRILTIGGSNWTHQRLEEANRYAAEHGLRGFDFNSPNLSLAKAQDPYWPDCVSLDSEGIAWHTRSGMPLLSWSSLSRGFFTGRFTPEDRSNADLVRVFYNDDNWERYRRAESMAADKGVTTIQIALAYVLNQPFQAGAIIGSRNEAEFKSCLDATQIKLTPEELAWLDLSELNLR
ncbi:aldo/keto reductase [Paenibacillus swuensis]|uniref:Aldo/keto reductase n=1 Tax=Paenibacillus swuensis TaxID=1178515 RepID=A0A172TFG4_9BACL|nr:aldo/keto reductase [Paenibacillus swuensis]ANE45644.1 aldo/keto reductase [Paenibacillus swuensis]